MAGEEKGESRRGKERKMMQREGKEEKGGDGGGVKE